MTSTLIAALATDALDALAAQTQELHRLKTSTAEGEGLANLNVRSEILDKEGFAESDQNADKQVRAS